MTTLVLLARLALADNVVTTFVIDPQYTPPPFAGLEQLYVDPAATAAQLKPLPAPPEKAERASDEPAVGALVFTNPMNNWAELAINGVKIGTIGPYATARLAGFAAGTYAVAATIPTGFTRSFAVQVR